MYLCQRSLHASISRVAVQSTTQKSMNFEPAWSQQHGIETTTTSPVNTTSKTRSRSNNQHFIKRCNHTTNTNVPSKEKSSRHNFNINWGNKIFPVAIPMSIEAVCTYSNRNRKGIIISDDNAGICNERKTVIFYKWFYVNSWHAMITQQAIGSTEI